MLLQPILNEQELNVFHQEQERNKLQFQQYSEFSFYFEYEYQAFWTYRLRVDLHP